MANIRHMLMDTPVNPAIMPGFRLIAGEITADDGAVITIPFAAKTIFVVIAQTTGTGVAKTKSVSADIGTVTFTATGDGTISYIIMASVTETVDDLDIDTDSTYTLTPIT